MSTINSLKEVLKSRLPLAEISSSLKEHRQLILKGAPGSLRAFIAAFLVEAEKRIVWISARSSRRDEALSDLSQILPNHQVGVLLTAHDKGDITPFETRIFRARALQSWTQGYPYLLITDPASFWDKILPSPENLDRIRMQLTLKKPLGRDFAVKRLAQAGYVRSDLVANRGEFAVRGGILDIFPYTHDHPLRLEFWGEILESLRAFDPVTQRTIAHLQNETLFLTDVVGGNEVNLATYLQPDDILFIEEAEEIVQLADHAGYADYWNLLCKNCYALFWGTTRQDLQKISIGGIPQEDFGGQIARLAQSLNGIQSRDGATFIACDNQGQLDRLNELLSDQNISPPPHFLVAHITAGFHLPAAKFSLFTDHQIFRRPRRRRTYFRLRNFSPIERADMLRRGDYVVHEDYGIGRFVGLTTIEVGGHTRECMQIEYRDNVMLYVRLESLRKIQKFSGREGFIPPLTRIGRGEWERIRKKTSAAIKELAADLLKLYALRSTQKGFAFPPDHPLQLELEAKFDYEETPDQLAAIEAVKRDMEEPQPMDRLVCGDVGYGKTEVALRAAFKAVLGGKQVAILVPTTLLAQQHYNTFRSRLADLAVEVEMLSRFRKTAQQKEILRRIQSGRVDIVIGTHRLLSKDVVFDNLGLLIVDEEHRFGVKHKEQLKKLRTQVDVLVLTATPIPRTLHMALIGARDMSLIKTPPQHRLPIETEIAPFSQELITGAILREIDRGGQVYFVHNRISSILAMQKMLERWMPEVRFVVGHGQMPEQQLEKTMNDFWAGKYDVLISTMIIESGLDLPNVNTMIVNRADRFGLAQLYQLRGRIGRSNRQAYAYLLTPPKLSVSDPARKRLDAIRDCSYLGAGFQLALQDLEIRGAGEIFGAKQSGFIHAVGFDLYQKMLNEAIHKLNNDSGIPTASKEAESSGFEPKIDLPFDALLPKDYIEHPEHRVELYRRLSSAQDVKTLRDIVEEVSDRYGAPPRQARNLFDLIEIKIGCQKTGLSRLEMKKNYLAAELFAGKDLDWKKQLSRIVRNLDGLAIEFTGTTPPGLILRWNPNDSWDDKIQVVKKIFERMT